MRRSAERPADVSQIAIPGGTIDLARREVRFAKGGRAELSEREAELLRYLAANAGRAIAREELLANVWRIPPRGVSTRTIDMHVTRLREKLRDDSAEPKILLTVRGKGYMFQSTKSLIPFFPMFPRLSLWLIFAACLAVVLAAMGWISLAAVRLDRAEAEARRQTEWRRRRGWPCGGSIRRWRRFWPKRALGRFSSIGRSFRPVRTLSRMLNPQTAAGSVIPSPLLRNPSAEVIAALPVRAGRTAHLAGIADRAGSCDWRCPSI